MWRIANKSVTLALLFLVVFLVVSPDVPISTNPSPTIEFERAASAVPADEGPDQIEAAAFLAEAFVLTVASSIVLIRKEEDQRVMPGVGAAIFVPPKVC